MSRIFVDLARAFHKPWRVAGWGAIFALIVAPAIAMQFTTEVNWDEKDFTFAIVMLGGVGLAFEMAVRAQGSAAYRGGVAVALGTGLLLLWGNAAVGIVGDEGNDINFWFNLVPLIAVVGAFIGRFRSSNMAVAMTIAATAQVTAGCAAQFSGHFTWVFTLLWAGAWLFSAWLFWKAAHDA